jgi:hypothetical protein
MLPGGIEHGLNRRLAAESAGCVNRTGRIGGELAELVQLLERDQELEGVVRARSPRRSPVVLTAVEMRRVTIRTAEKVRQVAIGTVRQR